MNTMHLSEDELSSAASVLQKMKTPDANSFTTDERDLIRKAVERLLLSANRDHLGADIPLLGHVELMLERMRKGTRNYRILSLLFEKGLHGQVSREEVENITGRSNFSVALGSCDDALDREGIPVFIQRHFQEQDGKRRICSLSFEERKKQLHLFDAKKDIVS